MPISCQSYKSSFMAPLAHLRGVERGDAVDIPPYLRANTSFVYPYDGARLRRGHVAVNYL